MKSPKPAYVIEQPIEQKTEHYREFYSNFSRMAVTPYDLGLALGRIDPSMGAGSRPTVLMEATAIMSPYQFKVFVNSMNLILAQWEKQFGVININPALLMRAETFQAMQDSQNATYENLAPES